MVQIWHSIRGFVAGVVAFVTCPCYLPITLPLLIALTSGTVFGTWLADERNIMIIGGLSTIIFIGGLALVFKWTGEARPSVSNRYIGLPRVTPITSSTCAPCEETKTVPGQVRERVDFKFVRRRP